MTRNSQHLGHLNHCRLIQILSRKILHFCQGILPQAKIVLPGQEAVTPTTYSGNTMPFGIGPSPVDAHAFYGPSSMPKAEPLGASILYPTMPASYPNNAQLPPVPPSHRGLPKGALWIAMPIVIAVVAIVLALVAIPVSAAWLANNTTKTPAKAVSSQPTTVAAIPTAIPTIMPTPTVTNANSVSVNGVTLTPNSLNVQNDCQSGNEFQCTVTLSLSPDANNAVSWSGSIDGVDSSLHPRRGTLEPGQQQKISMSLFDTCPIDAQLNIAVKHQHSFHIPLQCN